MCRTRAWQLPGRTSHVFLRDGERPLAGLTYAELDQRARSVAAELARHAQPGDRALLCYPPGLEFLAGFFGCLYAGVIAVPTAGVAEGRGATARLAAIARSATPRLLLSTADFLAGNATRLAETVSNSAVVAVATDRISARPPARAWTEPDIDADTIAYLQYSSGSTGEPRGVVLTHRQVLHNLGVLAELLRPRPEETSIVSWLPLFHDMGLVAAVIMPVFAASTATLMSPTAFLRRPLRWLTALQRAEVTATPNFALDLCLRRTTEQQRAQLDLRRVRHVVVGAEPVRADTLERFASAFAPSGLRPEALVPAYGLAEATLMVSGGPTPAPPVCCHASPAALGRDRIELTEPGTPAVRLVGCGQVRPGLRVVIVEPESLRPRPPGHVGEVCVAGGSVGSGYWNAPEATAATFGVTVPGVAGAFLRTGDLGAVVDGQLVITGRCKDVIVIDGHNHYPSDIERTVAAAHPALRPGFQIAVSVDDGQRERVVVLTELSTPAGANRQSDVDEVDLADGVDPTDVADGAAGWTLVSAAVRAAVLAQHGIAPHDVVLLPPGALPFTSSGKPQRFACRRAYQDGGFARVRLGAAGAAETAVAGSGVVGP
ncbi:fatty acyl-AMP ligase [Goodfellowiella coeruleoviolacea]|nr:fatty acyl-AMP ligase [Goodfellowiella coeruleoviolacea]